MVSTRSGRHSAAETSGGSSAGSSEGNRRTGKNPSESKLGPKRTGSAVSKATRSSTRKTSTSGCATGITSSSRRARAVVVEGHEAGVAALGGRLRRAASRGVQRVVAALVDVGADVDVGDVGDVVAGEVGDEELYKPEETVRGKRAKRKVEKLAAGTGAASGTKPTKRTKKTTKNTEAGEASKAVQKKRARYRVPDLVERAFYEAGSVILGQLSMLIGDTLSSIRECKVLLDMGLVSGDAFAEVFGGRPDHLKMRKADLKRLVQSAGIRGLASGSLEEMRSDPRSRALAFLSVDNYHLWLNAEESELLASFKSSVLPGEPAWLESLINKRTDVFDVYRTALEKKLHVPKPILESMEYFTSCIQISTGWRRSFEQTTYLYRASVAISVAVRWRAFKGLKELDISKIVSENSDMRSSLDTEGRVRKEILARADQVRKQWKKAGVNLDATLSSGHFPERFPVTEKFLLDGGADNLSKSVLAAQTRVKYNIPDEQEASRFHAKMTRFTSLSAALLKLKLTVSSELDPSADPADERVSKVRKELDVSWPWVCGGTGRVEVAVDAHKAWLEFGNVPSVSNESSAKLFCSKVARFTSLSAALLKLKLTVPSELDPRADPADERVSKVRKELDVSWPWVCGGTGRVEVAVDAHKAWLEFGNVPSVSNESSAKLFCSKVARFTSLSAALLKLKLTVPSELDPSADPADERVSKVRKELDVSWPWVCGGTGRVEVAVDAHKAWLEFGNVPAVASEVCAMKYARLEDVRREWRKHQLEDVDMLSINMTDELAEKYGVTKDYIDGNLIGNAKSLASALNARLAMRDAKLDSECPSLKIDNFPRQPGENHVYICPCGYRAGRFKMECHVRKNSGNAVRAHKTGY